MRSRTFFQSVVACLLFLVSSSAFALNIPNPVREALEKKGMHFILYSWSEIPTVTPHQFTLAFLRANAVKLGNGFGGIAFKGDHGVLFKVSHGIFSDRMPTRLDWGWFLSLPSTLQLNIPQHQNRQIIENAAERRSSGRELLGTLLWSIYEPTTQELFPFIATDDSYAYSRPMAQGVTLKSVLKAQQNTTNPSLDHIRYNSAKLWRRFVEIQDKAERMLLELGVVVDLLNPENLIVSGPLDDPKIVLIDHEFLAPSKETVDYYNAMGVHIPASILGEQYDKGTFKLPVMQDQLLVNDLWGLTFEQALEYIKISNGLGDDNAGLNAAMIHLSKVAHYTFDVPVSPANYSNVALAQSIIASGCQSDLIDKQN